VNPRLDLLQPYPFEKLRVLLHGATPPAGLSAISLGIGEPKHPTPQFIRDALTQHLDGLAVYPSTVGTDALRQACAQWAQRRYGIGLDAQTQVLPVNGSREALFAIAQTVVDASLPEAAVVCPNPFYQIYEGAALLAGARPYFAAVDAQRNFAVDWGAVPGAVWQNTQLVYVCSPGNPTGAVMPLAEWERLFALSDRYGFVIASDECYSEIWFGDQPPLGALQAAWRLGRKDYRNLLMFTSLSKRSNVPGLRSGFVAGDASLIAAFARYRTYHGSAMSPAVQAASAAAWSDEEHVAHNRALYREKFAAVLPILQPVMDVRLPDAGFYLWAATPVDDAQFARGLFEKYNVTVLPGSYLARAHNGVNPGSGRVRMALVAPLDECVDAARRIAAYCSELRSHSALLTPP